MTVSPPFYSFFHQRELTSCDVEVLYGLDVTEDTTDEFLAGMKLYRVNELPELSVFTEYTGSPSYVVNNNRVDVTRSTQDTDVDDAKEDALILFREKFRRAVQNVILTSLYTPLTIAAADDIAVGDRSASLQAVIDVRNSVVTRLSTLETSIDSAVTTADVRNLVLTDQITVHIGRTGRDINDGYIPVINLPNISQSDLELYIPSTKTVLSYRTDLGPTNHFGGTGNEFLPVGDPDEFYEVIVRHAATGISLGKFECLDGANQANKASIDDFDPIGDGADNFTEPGVEEEGYLPYSQLFEVTVANGKFYIYGEEQANVVMSLGAIYRFSQEDGSNTGHPLLIYDDANKTTEITASTTVAGVPGQSGSYTEFIPPATGTYSYQCSIHAAMGGLITVVD